LRAGCLVLDHAPADLLLLCLRPGGKHCALRRRQHAALAELVVLLERAHRSHRALVEFAIDEAVVVAGPGEVELDADALRERHRAVAAGWRLRRRRALL